MISDALSEILGLLCAEGCLVDFVSNYYENSKGKVRLRKNKRQYRIEFYSKDKKLLLHLKNLLSKEFDYTVNITRRNKINIGTKKVIQKILEHTLLGHLRWNVPLEVLHGVNKVKRAFVRGFFDGDGSFGKQIRFTSTNKCGLEQVATLIGDLGFTVHYHKPNIKPGRKIAYTLVLSSNQRERFLNEIAPVSKRPDLRGSSLYTLESDLQSKVWSNAQDLS